MDDFAGVGLTERVGIGGGWFVGGGEVFGLAGFDQVAFVVGGWMVEVFKGPKATVDAVLKDCLDGGEIKSWAHS